MKGVSARSNPFKWFFGRQASYESSPINHYSHRAEKISPNLTPYQNWLRLWDYPSEDQIQWMFHQISTSLRVVVYMPIADPRSNLKSLRSLEDCEWKSWHLYIPMSADKKPDAKIARILNSKYRDRVTNQHLLFSSYDIAIVIEPGCILRKHALVFFLYCIQKLNSDCWLFFADEDCYSRKLGHHNPFIKPSITSHVEDPGVFIGGLYALDLTKSCAIQSFKTLVDYGNDPGQSRFNLPTDLCRRDMYHIPHVLHHRNPRHQLCHGYNPHPEVVQETSLIPHVDIVIVSSKKSDNQIYETIENLLIQRDILIISLVVVCECVPCVVVSQLKRLRRCNILATIASTDQRCWSDRANIGAHVGCSHTLFFIPSGIFLNDRLLLSRMARKCANPNTGVVAVHHNHDLAWLLCSSQTYSLGNLHHDSNLERTWRQLNCIDWKLDFVMGSLFALSRENYALTGGLPANESLDTCQTKVSQSLYHLNKDNFSCAQPFLSSSLICLTDRASHKLSSYLESHPPSIQNPKPTIQCRAISPHSFHRFAVVPQLSSVWNINNKRDSKTILILSCVLARGYGVALVVKVHARHLHRLGYNIIVAGPSSPDDFDFFDCKREIVQDEYQAAILVEKTIPLLTIVHTPPFFNLSCLLSTFHKILAIDHGEPPAYLFTNSSERLSILKQKEVSLSTLGHVYSISQAVADESSWDVQGFIGLGNTHMDQWNNRMKLSSLKTRHDFGWSNKWVILSVSRIQHRERSYKGINHLYELRCWMDILKKSSDRDLVFVLCGKGKRSDEQALLKQGFTIFRNIDDRKLSRIYAASDVYVSYSQWEGYNLGIAQALAMGLKVFASDIPAHRNFNATLSNDLMFSASSILDHLRHKQPPRIPERLSWRKPLQDLTVAIQDITNPDTLANLPSEVEP